MDKIINVVDDWESYLDNCSDKYYKFNTDLYKWPHCALKHVCIENTYKFLKGKFTHNKHKVLYVWRPNLW